MTLQIYFTLMAVDNKNDRTGEAIALSLRLCSQYVYLPEKCSRVTTRKLLFGLQN